MIHKNQMNHISLRQRNKKFSAQRVSTRLRGIFVSATSYTRSQS